MRIGFSCSVYMANISNVSGDVFQSVEYTLKWSVFVCVCVCAFGLFFCVHVYAYIWVFVHTCVLPPTPLDKWQMFDTNPFPRGTLYSQIIDLHLVECCRPDWPLMSASHTHSTSQLHSWDLMLWAGPHEPLNWEAPRPLREGSAIHGGSVPEGSPKPMGFRLN